MAAKKHVSMPDTLPDAAADAVRFLVETMNNGEEKTELRIKCAGALLDRAAGGDSAAEPLVVVMGAAGDLAK